MNNDTITFFNRKTADAGDVWYPTVIKNAHLIMDKAPVLEKYGPDANDSAALHIGYTADGVKKMVGKKCWLSPKQWQQTQDPASCITFSGGDKFDFFWLGEWQGEDPVKDADYAASGDFFTHMKQTHDFVFAVSSVGGPYSVIPHFEIVGK